MLKRFSISLEESLLDTFDRSIQAHQYDDCSDAIGGGADPQGHGQERVVGGQADHGGQQPGL